MDAQGLKVSGREDRRGRFAGCRGWGCVQGSGGPREAVAQGNSGLAVRPVASVRPAWSRRRAAVRVFPHPVVLTYYHVFWESLGNTILRPQP